MRIFRQYSLPIMLATAGLYAHIPPVRAMTPPIERDICKIDGTVKELREAEHAMPWHSDNMQKVIEVAIQIHKAELLDKRTTQDSSRCVMYEGEQVEWFKLCDEVVLTPGLRISASEGTTIGAGLYCVFDIDIIDH